MYAIRARVLCRQLGQCFQRELVARVKRQRLLVRLPCARDIALRLERLAEVVARVRVLRLKLNVATEEALGFCVLATLREQEPAQSRRHKT